MRNLFRTILAVTVATVLAVTSPQSPNFVTPAAASGVLETCAALQTDVTNGVFIWAGSAQTCPANNKQTISRATFISWIANSGACPGSGAYYQLRRDQMLGCAVLRHSFSGSFSTSSTYSCTSSACTKTGSSYTVYTTPSNTAPPINTGTQISFTVNTVTSELECNGSSSGYSVALINPTGGTVFSGAVVGFSYSSGGAAGGAYISQVIPSGTASSCFSSLGGATGTKTQTVNGTYTASEAY